MNNRTNDIPNILLSIIVITYNSEPYVKETLDSIKNQDYSNIELIISDDCSSDNTIEICQNWIKENSNIFIRTRIITSDTNTGISANCNRGFKAAQGEWIKFLAGDDLLIENSLYNIMEYLYKNTEIKLLICRQIAFGDIPANYYLIENRDRKILKKFSRLLPYEQERILYQGYYLNSPPMFIKRELLISIGGFKEKFKKIEDAYLFISSTRIKSKIFYYDYPIVYYRVHNKSISRNKDSRKIFNNIIFDRREFEKDIIYPNIGIIAQLKKDYYYYLCKYFEKYGLNNSSFKIYKKIYYILLKLNIFLYIDNILNILKYLIGKNKILLK